MFCLFLFYIKHIIKSINFLFFLKTVRCYGRFNREAEQVTNAPVLSSGFIIIYSPQNVKQNDY